MAADLDVLVPGWFACRRLGIKKQTLRYWVTSGKLSPRRHDPAGRPLYRYGDVVAVEKATRDSRMSSRSLHRAAGAAA